MLVNDHLNARLGQCATAVEIDTVLQPGDRLEG